MNAATTALSTVLDPVVAASAVLIWTPAALLAVTAQLDGPGGPAPRTNRRAAGAALRLVTAGLALAAAQAIAAAGALVGWVPPPAEALAWPALVACLTGAGVVVLGAVAPLRRLRRGRAVTDEGQWRRLHAALRTGVVSGALAAIAVVLGAGLRPVGDVAGPYLAPMALVALAVLGAHAALRFGLVAR